MLVCNVSQRPPRRAIAAGIVEAGAAADALGTGNVVFATLVDDPASVSETVDAYLGEIMLEAAGASDAVTAGSVYIATVDEAVPAIATVDGTLASAAIRSAMIAGQLPAMVNSGTSRESNAAGIMVNI